MKQHNIDESFRNANKYKSTTLPRPTFPYLLPVYSLSFFLFPGTYHSTTWPRALFSHDM